MRLGKSILMKCTRCGRDTLRKDKCPYCGGPVKVPHPPKFSMDDRMWRYRLAMKVAQGQFEVSEDVKRRVLEGFKASQ